VHQLADVTPDVALAGIAFAAIVALPLFLDRIEQLRKGSRKAKALLHKGQAFFFISLALAIGQTFVDYSGLASTATFGPSPRIPGLITGGWFAFAVGGLYTFWMIDLMTYPSRGYGLTRRLIEPAKSFALLGVALVDSFLIYPNILAILAHGFSGEGISPIGMIMLILSVSSLSLLFFDKLERKASKATAWAVALLPVLFALSK